MDHASEYSHKLVSAKKEAAVRGAVSSARTNKTDGALTGALPGWRLLWPT